MTKKGQDVILDAVALNKRLNIRKCNSASEVNALNYLEKIGQKSTLLTEKLR